MSGFGKINAGVSLFAKRRISSAPTTEWFDENKRFYFWWCHPDEFVKDSFKSKGEHEDENNDKLDDMTSSVDSLDIYIYIHIYTQITYISNIFYLAHVLHIQSFFLLDLM